MIVPLKNSEVAIDTKSYLLGLALAGCMISEPVLAQPVPGSGKLLVATEEVRGAFFQQTVVLLLHYDATGAMGLVINRPMEATPKEILPDFEGINGYDGTLYWGGPVQLASLRALLRSDSPPDDSIPVFASVYQVPLDRAMPPGASDSAHLRFFVGYAGWSPGQLDAELERNSWHIVPATEDIVFAKDPQIIWQQLMPPQQYRAARPEPAGWRPEFNRRARLATSVATFGQDFGL